MSSPVRLTKTNLPPSPQYSSFRGTIASSTASEFGSSSSATGETAADLTFREMTDHNSHYSSPQRDMSGLTGDSSVAHPSDQQNNSNDNNNGGSIPDQYYFHDDYSQATVTSKMNQDATKAVTEMHYALLYLMSNVDEFKRAVSQQPSASIDLPGSIADWHYKLYNDSEVAQNSPSPIVPLPYIVFAPDAEVVLPQAHTASQLFGVEIISGVELEAAAGVPALSQLFLRWLALMPGGDHLNIVDPPGLTIMRIAGGRYRVTAAHRVVWTWYNEFLPEALPQDDTGEPQQQVAFEDLVTMTIVDVFETDRDGRLLSYCPTFDNRAVHRTTQASERISKQGYKLRKRVDIVRNSKTAKGVNKAASFLGRMSYSAAKKSYDFVKKEVERQTDKSHPGILRSPSSASYASSVPRNNKGDSANHKGISASSTMKQAATGGKASRSEHYISDDETASAFTER